MKATPIALLALCAGLLPGADVHIPYQRYTLNNGLRVILSQDHAVPVVSVYLLYDVGARSEEKGRTGFAHLFEHMMFEGSANAPKGTFDTQIEGNGGSMNGSTHPDFTDYFETLPSNKLATALWLESDRMRSLAITDANLANQKEAVKQERRLSFDNQPYATAIVDTWPTLAYQNWHNSHSLIGSFEDLNAATTADVRNFFRTYYAPNNAVLAIVGDIDIPAAKKLVESYFGDIPRQAAPQRPDLSEPAAAPKTEVVHDKLARVPAVVIGYPGPKRRSPDYYAMYMVDAILTGGTSSRFNLDLVKGKESVIQYEANLGWPFAGPSDYRDPEDYAMNLLYKPNFTGQQIVDQVQGEIDRLQTQGVSAQDLERVRALVRSTYIQQLQNSLSRARMLAQYEAFDHDADYINTELDRFLAVTPEQVRAAARQYLSPAHRVVMEILPSGDGRVGRRGGEGK